MSAEVVRPDFPIDSVVARIRRAVAGLPPAVMFHLADEGHRSVFEQVVACIVSVRTLEETTLPVCRRLFAAAPTPAAMAELPVADIDDLIRPSTFHEQKAARLRDIARRTVEEFGGFLPCDEGVILGLPGVGPKCAALALGIGCGLPLVGVDIHVHRIANRWGYVRGTTPEQTAVALTTALPDAFKVEINRLLVPFGKFVCTGTRPRCSQCPVADDCWQVGVTNPR